MDSDGLPLVGPGIDYRKVEAIHQKRTIAFLNHFISHTARFLNHFSGVCEEKLSDLSVRIQRLEFTMNILETKLSSIPGLENVTAPSSSSSAAGSSTSPAVSGAGTTTPSQSAASSTPSAAPPEPVEETKPQMTVSQDPRYIKFFKMIKVGVPPPAIKMKMTAEGLDPDLLDNPDAPVPDGGVTKEDSDDDFSDKSDDASDDDDDDDDSSGFSD